MGSTTTPARPLHHTANEDGFTLVELLVVILIIGVLVAVAVPFFLGQRKTAVEASMKSDLHNAATEMETAYIKDRAYPATLPTTVKTSDGTKIKLAGAAENAAWPFDKITYDPKRSAIAEITTSSGAKVKYGVQMDMLTSADGKSFLKGSDVYYFDPARTSADGYLRAFPANSPIVNERAVLNITFRCANGTSQSISNSAVTFTSHDGGALRAMTDFVNSTPNCGSLPAIEFSADTITQERFNATQDWAALSAKTPKQTMTWTLPTEGTFCLTATNTGGNGPVYYSSAEGKIAAGTC